jgi:hypothetical protein
MAYVKKIWKDYPDTTTPILASDMSNIENGIEAVDTALENLENNVNNIEDGLETVTNNVNNGWYQTGISPTFTFVSWDNSVRTGVVNSNLDLTPYLSVGMKVKFTQSATVKFGIITAITSTQLTLFLGTDYSLNTSAISNSYYSMLKTPYGFPLNPDKWSVIFTDVTQRNQTNPVNLQWYNIANVSLTVPIGLWWLSYNVLAQADAIGATAGNKVFRTTLSTTANGQTNPEFTNSFGTSSVSYFRNQSYKELLKSIDSSQIWYLNTISDTSIGSLYNLNEASMLIIKARCAYL